MSVCTLRLAARALGSTVCNANAFHTSTCSMFSMLSLSLTVFLSPSLSLSVCRFDSLSNNRAHILCHCLSLSLSLSCTADQAYVCPVYAEPSFWASGLGFGFTFTCIRVYRKSALWYPHKYSKCNKSAAVRQSAQ